MDEVPVFGALCFVEAAWPLISGDFVVDDIAVLWPKKLADRLVPKTPVLVPDQVEEARRRLAAALASA